VGPFTQPDPIGLAGGLNLYGYADGDPINRSDPFGLCPTCGDEAQEFYASIATDSERSGVARASATVGGVISALWTSDTWKSTAAVLTTAAPVGRALGSFKHFGNADDAAGFAGGLRPGSFATNSATTIRTGEQARGTLALPHAQAPNAVYTVKPEFWRFVRGPSRVKPANGQPGGGWEYQFPTGTGPGTVSAPKPIP
jgi:hypothetical protein